MDASDTYQVIILIILLALSAFFSSNETALMAVNKIRLRTLADDGNKRAAKVLDIVENHTSKLCNIKRRKNYITLYSGSQLFYDDHDSVHLHHQSVFKNLYEASACGS